jgi:hypothetical protein
MKSYIASIVADVRANPDVSFLFGMIMAGELIATTVCLYFAFTLPHRML